MKDKIHKIILASLDSFLIMFFPLVPAKTFLENGTINPTKMELLGFSFYILVMPILCKYISLKISKENDIKAKVKEDLSHLIAGYIVFFTSFIFLYYNSYSLGVILTVSFVILLIMYLLFGEYNFRIGITTKINREE